MSPAPETGPNSSPLLPISPLIGFGEWIGTILYWQPATTASQLIVTLAPDSAVLTAKKGDALTLYRQVETQFSEAHDLQVVVSSALDSDATPSPDQAAPKAVTAYVSAVIAYLSNDGPLPPPVILTYLVRQLSPAVPPIQVTVTVTLSRQTVDDTTTPKSGVEQVATPAAANVGESLTLFAKGFRHTFPTLRLAVESRRFDPRMLWAFGAPLIQPTIAGNPTLFAPAPLATQPQSGIASVPDFGDFSQGNGWPERTHSFSQIDCDQLLARCFETIDDLNAEPFASAAMRAEPDSARTITDARSRLAKAYSQRQLTRVFESPAPDDSGHLRVAREAYSDALEDSLANAYAIDAMVASEVTWTKLPGSWSSQGLSLLGTVRPIDRSRAFPTASARVKIAGTTKPTGTLSYPFRPRSLSANTTVTLPPLELLVTHVGLADTPEGTPIWLALITPEVLSVGDATEVIVPVVNRFQPMLPALRMQSATPTVPTDPTWSQLFQWDYSVDIELRAVAQDRTSVAIRPNIPPDSPSDTTRAPAESALAAALFRFEVGFVSLAPALQDVVAGKPSAANVVRAIADLVSAIKIDSDGAPARNGNDPARNGDGASIRLGVSLSADATAPGKWQVTVTGDNQALPEMLAILPMTLARVPQPNLTIVRTNPLVISYEPQDPTAQIILRISLQQLDLRVAENSGMNVQIFRNLALQPQFTTVGGFISATPWSGFSQPATPSISGPAEGYDIAAIGTPPSSGLLIDWLQMLFDAIFATGPTRRANVSVAYEYNASTSTADTRDQARIPIRLPVLLARSVPVGQTEDAKTPAVLASEMGESIAAWMAATSPSRERGYFILDLALMTAHSEEDRVLLAIPNFRLAVDDVKIPG